jgi:hypothetical protein
MRNRAYSANDKRNKRSPFKSPSKVRLSRQSKRSALTKSIKRDRSSSGSNKTRKSSKKVAEVLGFRDIRKQAHIFH